MSGRLTPERLKEARSKAHWESDLGLPLALTLLDHIDALEEERSAHRCHDCIGGQTVSGSPCSQCGGTGTLSCGEVESHIDALEAELADETRRNILLAEQLNLANVDAFNALADNARLREPLEQIRDWLLDEEALRDDPHCFCCRDGKGHTPYCPIRVACEALEGGSDA